MNRGTGKQSLYFQSNIGGLPSKISWYVRRKMFEYLMQMVNPTVNTSVLDVGVTSDPREDCNFFEKLYPYPHKIIAVGTENASFLEKDFPGLKFLKADGIKLPFPDKSFDLVVCFATVEHVGSRDKQRLFVRELCRVGRSCCITTPNRFYPIEFHTILPFIHWFSASCFRFFAKLFGKEFFAKEENLNLLSEKELLGMFPEDIKVQTRHFRLFGLISHFVFYITDTR